MEVETIAQIIALSVLGILQLFFILVMSMGAFIFKSSITNLKESFTASMSNLDRTVQEIKQDRSQDNDTLYGKINVIEKEYASRREVEGMIEKHLPSKAK